MDSLKKILLISATAFFVAGTVAIVISINSSTNFFKSTINLACQPDGTDIDFSLSISKGTVIWNSAGVGRDRELDLLSDTTVVMTWYNDDNKLSTFTLNRLTGNFNLRVEDETNRAFGRCYETSPKF